MHLNTAAVFLLISLDRYFFIPIPVLNSGCSSKEREAQQLYFAASNPELADLATRKGFQRVDPGSNQLAKWIQQEAIPTGFGDQPILKAELSDVQQHFPNHFKRMVR
jgi:hypothetical protein